MIDQQRLRYSRHLLLDDWSESVQERLLQSRVLVVGAGGLGAPALLYLASAGVGRLTVVDPDVVDLTNLQRQVIHTTARIGQAKVWSAAQCLADLNPEVQVHAVQARADTAWLAQHVPQADLVLDCSDNFATRHAINLACRAARVPLVSASALGFAAQVTVFDARQPESPCYACLFPPDQVAPDALCATMGVFAPVVGVLGAMQAGEGLKILGELGPEPGRHQSLCGRLLMLDARSWRWTEVQVRRSANCPVCAEAHI